MVGGESYEHFHVPSSPFIQSSKTRIKTKKQFFRAWELETADLIRNRPNEFALSKVVSILTFPDLWCSEIIIFNDEEYYKKFFDRPEWLVDEEKTRLLNTEEKQVTSLEKRVYLEVFDEGDCGILVVIGEL